MDGPSRLSPSLTMRSSVVVVWSGCGPMSNGSFRCKPPTWHPGVCVQWREPPPPAAVGAVGGQCLDLCGGHFGGSGHGLLGSVLPSDVWALAAGATARGFFRDPRAGKATS